MIYGMPNSILQQGKLMSNSLPPIVMSIAGHDPTGGAGIQADIEAIHAAACYPVSVLSCLTVQDTHNVHRIEAVSSELLLQQARTLLEDMPIRVIKLGLLGSEANIIAVSQLLSEYPDIPVVCDPILAAGGGKSLSNTALIETLKKVLLPHVDLLTPNIPEAIKLGIFSQKSPNYPIVLTYSLCHNILITGTHSDSKQVHNSLYCNGKLVEKTTWNRLKHEYHGSGCTLASNISAWLAQGLSLQEAVNKGQAYTWNSLDQAQCLGQGQHIPYRI